MPFVSLWICWLLCAGSSSLEGSWVKETPVNEAIIEKKHPNYTILSPFDLAYVSSVSVAVTDLVQPGERILTLRLLDSNNNDQKLKAKRVLFLPSITDEGDWEYYKIVEIHPAKQVVKKNGVLVRMRYMMDDDSIE